jgi:hypothetical protein
MKRQPRIYMKTCWHSLSQVLIVLMSLFLISGCSFHFGDLKIGETRLGMVGSKSPGSLVYSYRTFSGFESQDFQAEAGEMLEVSYHAVVERGSLTIEVQDPERNVIWSRTLDVSQEQSFTLPLEKSGRHGIIVHAKDASGSFEINWMVKSIEG